MSPWKQNPSRTIRLVRRQAEQLLALLISFETGGAARARLSWPRVPDSLFGPTWEGKVDVEVERIFSELEHCGLDLHSRTIIKQNRFRLRLVFRTESRLGPLVIKLRLCRPLARFGHLNWPNTETFVHSEVSLQVPNFIPKLVFGNESAIAIHYVEGHHLDQFASRSDSFDAIISSGTAKLRTLHNSYPGRLYQAADFSRDVDSLLNYWSQKRNPRWRDFWDSLGKLEFREASFGRALDKLWSGFNSYSSPPTSVLCAWDLNCDNFVVDPNEKLWLVDTEEFRYSLPVFDFAVFHSMAIEVSGNPESTFLRSKRSLFGLLSDTRENRGAFWEMYEGLLAAHLIFAVFDSERKVSDSRTGRADFERVSSRFQRLRPIIDELLPLT